MVSLRVFGEPSIDVGLRRVPQIPNNCPDALKHNASYPFTGAPAGAFASHPCLPAKNLLPNSASTSPSAASSSPLHNPVPLLFLLLLLLGLQLRPIDCSRNNQRASGCSIPSDPHEMKAQCLFSSGEITQLEATESGYLHAPWPPCRSPLLRSSWSL